MPRVRRNLQVIFMLEAFVKITAYGFIHRAHPSQPAYLTQPLNCLDFSVVVAIGASYVVMAITGGNGGQSRGIIRAMRILRVLTPLRIVMRSERMKVILRAFVVAIPGAGAVFVLVIMFLLVFAIVSVELFGDRLRRCCHCDDFLEPMRYTRNHTLIENKTECFDQNLQNATDGSTIEEYCWENPAYNFDSTADAFQTLFKVTTTHGWVDIMEAVVDSRGEDLQPERDHFSSATLFFVIFHVVVTFFMLNIFIGVMASSFSEANRTNLYTDAEKRWVRVLAMLNDFSPKEGGAWPANAVYCRSAPPLLSPFSRRFNWTVEQMSAENDSTGTSQAQRVWTEKDRLWQVRTAAKRIADRPEFEKLVTVVVSFNVLVLLVDHYPYSDQWHVAVTGINTVCLVVFTIEMVIKIAAWGLKRYLSDGLSQLDVLVVFGSWASIFVGVRSGLEVLRVFRTARILLILAHFDGLMALYSTILRCVPASIDVMMVSTILFFIYAVIGMNLFGDTPPMDCDIECPGRYNRADNFGDFFSSMMLLFQWATGQCQYNLMHDLATDSHNKWGSGIVFTFFASFKILSDYVCINLMVGIILDTFDNTYSTEKMPFSIEDLWWFRDEWARLVIGAIQESGDADFDVSNREQIIARIQKNPTKVSLCFDRLRALLHDMQKRNVLNFQNLDPRDRSYLLIQVR